MSRKGLCLTLYAVIIMIMTGLIHTNSILAQEPKSQESLYRNVRAAVGAEALEQKRSIRFKVITSDAFMQQETWVTLMGPNHASLEVVGRDSTLFVKNGDNYFLRMPARVIPITDKSSQQQIDAYIDLINPTRLIDWAKGEIKTNRAMIKDKPQITLSQGEGVKKVEITVDEKSNRLMSVSKMMISRGERVNATMYIDEYMTLDDVVLPKAIRTLVHRKEGDEVITQTVSDISFDKNLQPERFRAVKTRKSK